MKRVLISDNLAKEGIDILNAFEGLEVDVNTGLKPEELKEIIGNYDGLVIRSATKVTAEILEAAKNLKVVGRAGIGVDNVDVPAATNKGVIVMNTPGGNTTTTAEHALSLMMSLVRNIPQATASMKEGKWEKKKFQGHEMCGKTLGVIGLGAIGSIVADRALGLKMKVLAYDPFITPERAAELGVEKASLEELFAGADIITIHVPKLKETTDLINAATIATMKDGVYIVCAARGGIVNEGDLLAGLESGKVAGAALDVFSEEPPGLTPLVSHPNLICTPHLGASTEEAQTAVAIQVAEQIGNYLLKGVIVNSINVPSVSPEALEQMGPFLHLAEKLGALQAQLGLEAIRAVEIEYSGKAAEGRTPLLTAAALSGLLKHAAGEWVNIVNAPVTAKERGIDVRETVSSKGGDYTSLIRLNVVADKGGRPLAGAVFGKNEPRVVEIDGIDIEATPEGNMLILWNNDRPGLVGAIGTTLGERGINIGQLQFGRSAPGGDAITVINVDSEPDDATLEALGALDNVNNLHKVYL
ncbi:MAG: phosphoglycerate dehydrogenase [Deltaproteobacteria bacterium]|nr:MAG: phosphoglycerate dehydrogenase [Deltaproteobacteria bacterium]